MKNQKYVILTVALVVGIFGISLSVPRNGANKISNTDVAELLPASMKSADMLADNPGQWMFHCHVADHITAGMTSMYRVH
jgi:FtsP/CotA-like multicopper oxidase with cupredoxin domain